MSTSLLIVGGGLLLMPLLVASGLFLMRELDRQERFAARVRIIHGQKPLTRSGEAARLQALATRLVAQIGQSILKSGLLPAKTLSEVETTLAGSGLRGPQGVGIFIGCKLLLVLGLPVVAWLATRDMALSPLMRMGIPAIAGVVGLVAPDWLIGRKRKKYLERLEQGLPDALDMLVICTHAGLGLGPAIIRVATELQTAYVEIAREFGITASELQVMADSRVALTNMGRRTGLDSFRRLSTTLIQTLQYGTPISEALRILSGEMRQDLLVKFEENAARLPVMMTMPMIAFILPCVFMIAGGPAIIQVMGAFK
jgi:tight adherence protein C